MNLQEVFAPDAEAFVYTLLSITFAMGLLACFWVRC